MISYKLYKSLQVFCHRQRFPLQYTGLAVCSYTNFGSWNMKNVVYMSCPAVRKAEIPKHMYFGPKWLTIGVQSF